jgi:hypothetical protein
MTRVTPPPDPARVRAVLDLARATEAPPEALGWLLRLSREAEAKRAAEARNISPIAGPLAFSTDANR